MNAEGKSQRQGIEVDRMRGAPEGRFRVLIAERNPLVVAALGDMIKNDARFELVASVQSGEAFLAAVAEPKFDLAVLGWKLSDMNGAEVLEEMRQRAGARMARTVLATEPADPAQDMMRLNVQVEPTGRVVGAYCG